MSESWLRRVALVITLVILVLGFTRASLTRFQEKRRAVIQECRAEQKRLGITDAVALFAKYPTPEIKLITMACLTPGSTGDLVVKGRFVPGSKFLIESDNIEVVKESATATEYRATLKAPAGIGPEEADLEVYSPVSGANVRNELAVIVAGKFNWDLETNNGWRIKAKSAEDTRCKSRDSAGQMNYVMEFYKGAETKPFAKRNARLYFSPYESTHYRFDIQEEQVGGDVQAEVQRLMQKTMDPKLTDAEREKAMARVEALSQQMVAEMSKMADPSYVKELERKKQEFGCETLRLQVDGATANGELRCSQKVGSDIPVKGTLTLVTP